MKVHSMTVSDVTNLVLEVHPLRLRLGLHHILVTVKAGHRRALHAWWEWSCSSPSSRGSSSLSSSCGSGSLNDWNNNLVVYLVLLGDPWRLGTKARRPVIRIVVHIISSIYENWLSRNLTNNIDAVDDFAIFENSGRHLTVQLAFSVNQVIIAITACI